MTTSVRQTSSFKISRVDGFLWFCFFVWLVVDSITGYALNNGISLPLSQVFKLIILVLLTIKLSSVQRTLKFVICVMLYVGILNLHLGINNKDIAPTFIHLSKFISTIFIYIYFRLYINSCYEDFSAKANKILKIGFIVVAFNLALGFVGIGFHTYPDEQIGYKGFFFAGNELGGVIAAIVPFILYVVYCNFSLRRYIVLSVFVLAIAIILSTKSVLIICFLSVFAIPWILANSYLKRRIVVIGIIVGIPFFIYLINQIFSSESDFILRILYIYENKGLIGVIFSGRNEFWEMRSDEFFKGDFMVKFLGLGENKTVEMDLFDSILNYGYFGFTINIFIYLYLLFNAYIKRNNNTFVKILLFQNCLLLLMSVIAGHIVYSSMAGLYIALVNSLVQIKNKSTCIVTLKKY